MRIAILGTRGVPANYGGFETFAEHLSTRLVARGHEVSVYCRAHYVSPRQIEFQGVRLKVLPTIRHKYLDTVVHTFLSALHAARKEMYEQLCRDICGEWWAGLSDERPGTRFGADSRNARDNKH